MDSTFMTIHNLSSDANILFASDSIYDILGYQPRDVQGRSCFDYFHPEEVPLARYVHGRGVLMDKAASLHYARIRNAHGEWVGCECTFSIVHDILVACTSIYHRGEKSERRAQDTPQVRRLFSWPQDPRFHMLQHLSAKFTTAPPDRELRAALIINRFTRSLAIMFATGSIAEILGLEPAQLQHKSFYECIQDNCLDDAMECIEAAKANDSIAYLRFWSRDARREEEFADESGTDEDLNGDTLVADSSGSNEGQLAPGAGYGQTSASTSANRDSTPRRNSSDSEQGGVRLDAGMDVDSPVMSASPIKREPMSQEPEGASVAAAGGQTSGGSSSQQDSVAQSSASDTDSVVRPTRRNGNTRRRQRQPNYPLPSVEIEAFISCTSDGLVVILRRARQLPAPTAGPSLAESNRQGIFAAPWATQPVAAHYGPGAQHESQAHHVPQPPLHQASAQPEVGATGGPPLDELMASIQDVAVFAWALVGINRNLSSYSHGNPTGNAQPANDLFYDGKSSGTTMPPHSTSGNGVPDQAAPTVPQMQNRSDNYIVSDKGQPVEPRYTSYPELGANQFLSNGPWSNGAGGNWQTQPQPPHGQQVPSNGHPPPQQQMSNVNGGMFWGQGANGNDGFNGTGH